MNRFLKLTAVLATVAGFSLLANNGFARVMQTGQGTAKALHSNPGFAGSPGSNPRGTTTIRPKKLSRAMKATKATASRTHKHRINEYGNGLPNPDADSNGSDSGAGTNFPAPVTFGTGDGYGEGHGGGNGNPVKPHPRPIVGVPPIGVLTGAAKTP
ncbi:MAG TPA: hypothetical protein VHX65_20650 [Pirellulales bacterium]|jgi:hypothetical protein|nr:hypothetical protein [Pirellulales bacterium]